MLILQGCTRQLIVAFPTKEIRECGESYHLHRNRIYAAVSFLCFSLDCETCQSRVASGTSIVPSGVHDLGVTVNMRDETKEEQTGKGLVLKTRRLLFFKNATLLLCSVSTILFCL